MASGTLFCYLDSCLVYVFSLYDSVNCFEIFSEEFLKAFEVLLQFFSVKLNIKSADFRIHQRWNQEWSCALLRHEHLHVATILLRTWQVNKLSIKNRRLTFSLHLRGRKPGAIDFKLKHFRVIKFDHVIFRPMQIVHHDIWIFKINAVLYLV